MSLLLRDILARDAALYGTEPAVICERGTTTWGQLQARAFRLANRLAVEGVGRGDRVGVLQANGPEIVEVAFALALRGAVTVPISTRSSPAEAVYALRDAGARIAFVGAGFEPLVRDCYGLTVISTSGSDYESFVDEGASGEPPRIEEPDDPALQLYTSGTTGRPKGALISQRALIQNGLTTALSQRLTHDDVFLTMTPLTHAAGATRIFSLAIDGLANVLLERFDAQRAWAAVDECGVTTTIAVPAILRALLDALPAAKPDLSSLRLIVYGAAPTPRPLIEEALATLSCGFLHAYGLTEGCPALTALGPDEHRLAQRDPAFAHLLDSVGRPVPGVWLAIGTPGSDHDPREPGELWVRSTKSMLGYHGKPDATVEVLRDGWLATGDVARIDEHGYVYLVDRVKDMLISGGLNVYPSEIERVLHAAPEIAEACVVGVDDERWGEVPVAFVVARAGADVVPARLRERCARELARYKVPTDIVVLDRLPRGETGKVLKRELRERWMREARTVSR